MSLSSVQVFARYGICISIVSNVDVTVVINGLGSFLSACMHTAL